MQDPDRIFRRYQDLQSCVSWTEEDAARVGGLAPLLEPHIPALVADFHAEIGRHPKTHKVFIAGQAPVDRHKNALRAWLLDLLHGPYDRDYIARRWEVGARHVEMKLDQVYTNAALSRLRDYLVRQLDESWAGDRAGFVAAIRSLNKLLDLDLAKIEDACQAEYVARLQATERLATLGQIAGGVAHELRKPLNVVQSSVYFLVNARAAAPEKRAEHMRPIERGVSRATDVIATLSNFARVPEPELRPIPIKAWASGALEDAAVPDNIAVALEFPTDVPSVLADRNQLPIVLDNLVRNAVDAMPSGGRLTLARRRDEDMIELDVADTGTGLAAADLGRITDPLFSIRARGMGLGRALSRPILDKNRGELRVASEPGVGSRFTIRLAAVNSEGGSHP